MDVAWEEVMSLKIQLRRVLVSSIESVPAVTLLALEMVIVVVDVRGVHFEVTKGVLFDKVGRKRGAILAGLVIVHLNRLKLILYLLAC